MTDEQRADAAQRASEGMLDALAKAGITDDQVAAAMALGTVLGCMATASGNAGQFIGATLRITQGVVSGELLDP